VLGWLSKKFIEDPARTWRWLVNKRPRSTYAFVVGGWWCSRSPPASCSPCRTVIPGGRGELKTISAHPPACFGALAGPDCTNPALASKVIPDAGFGNADKPGHDDCFVSSTSPR